MGLLEITAIVVASFGSAWVGTYCARSAAYRLGLVSEPNPIVPQHQQSTAYLGGIGVLVGVLVGVIVGSLLGQEIERAAWFCVMAASFTVLGLVDDIKVLGVGTKFCCQAVLAIIVGYEFAGNLTGIGILDTFLAAFWVLVLVNAYNFTDVCDGLLAGIAAAAGLVWSLMADVGSATSLIFASACVGFLPFNMPRASVFLGDAGSHLLGFCMAVLSLEAVSISPIGAVVLAQLGLWGGVPLFELTFITVARVKKNLPWWRGSPDHFSLRLQSAGWNRLKIDLITWTAMAGSVALGWTLPRLASPWHAVVIVLAILAVLMVAARLWRYDVEPGG
ncbi:MAG: MraY family glycosyltransferase [Pseudomonadota bacterium]